MDNNVEILKQYLLTLECSEEGYKAVCDHILSGAEKIKEECLINPHRMP